MKSQDAIRAEIAELEDERARLSALDAQLCQRHRDLTDQITKLTQDRQDAVRETEEVRGIAKHMQAEIDALRRALAVLEDHAPANEDPQPAAEIEIEAGEPEDTDSQQAEAAKAKAEDLRERRRVEGRGGYKRQPGEVRTSITEGKADEARIGHLREEDLELVREILGDYGPISQVQIKTMLVELLGCPAGTASSIASRSLLKLRVDGVAEWTGETENTSKVWKINTEARA